MTELTMDTFFNGDLRVFQEKNGYRYSIDAILLARHANPKTGDTVIDLGTGCGIIPLILSRLHPEIRITGVEIQVNLAELAGRNVVENRLETEIGIVHEDFRRLPKHRFASAADMVICNPPYRRINSGRINPDNRKAVARHEITATLKDVAETAAMLLKLSGVFTTIYPAERLTEVLIALNRAGIEPKYLRSIHSVSGADAKLFILKGKKGANPGITIAPPLIIYEEGGGHTREVLTMYRLPESE